METHTFQRCDSLSLGRPPIQGRPEEVAGLGIVGRGEVIDPSALLVHESDGKDVMQRGSQGYRLPIGPTHPIHPPPSIGLAYPGEAPALVQPDQIVHPEINPSVIGLREDVAGSATGRISKEDLQPVLKTVQVLDDDLFGGGGPFHAGRVVVPGISLQLHPDCLPP